VQPITKIIAVSTSQPRSYGRSKTARVSCERGRIQHLNGFGWLDKTVLVLVWNIRRLLVDVRIFRAMLKSVAFRM